VVERQQRRLLDLFVVNYLAWEHRYGVKCESSPGVLDYCHPDTIGDSHQLFTDNGDGHLPRDVSAEPASAPPGKGMGVGSPTSTSTLDDIFVANDKVYNSSSTTKRGGKFEERSSCGVALPEDGTSFPEWAWTARTSTTTYPDIIYVALDYEVFRCFATWATADSPTLRRPAALPADALRWPRYSPTPRGFRQRRVEGHFRLARATSNSLQYTAADRSSSPIRSSGISVARSSRR